MPDRTPAARQEREGTIPSAGAVATEFEPTELVTLVKVAGGTVEELSPPEGIEPIHTP